MTNEVMEQFDLARGDIQDAQADAQRASLQHIDGLLFADSLHEVAESFGAASNANVARELKLSYAAKFTARYLDFRQGKSRAEAVKPNLTDQQLTALTKLGDELNMTGITSAFERPADIYVAHGSYGPGINERLLWTKQHLDVQADRFPDVTPIVVGATSDRPVVEADRPRPLTLAPYARTERHIMDGGFTRILRGRQIEPSDSGGNIRHYELPAGASGVTFSASKIEGRHLPNTADTHLHTATVLGAEALYGAEVVGVTTQVYVPFQKGDLLRTLGLGYGARIRMVGYRDPTVTQPHHIGQEYKAAIDQAVKLYQEVLVQRADRSHEL